MINQEATFSAPTVSRLRKDIFDVYGIQVDFNHTTKRDKKLFQTLEPVLTGNRLAAMINLGYSLGAYPPEYIRTIGISRVRFSEMMIRKPTDYHPDSPFSVGGTMDSRRGTLYARPNDSGIIHHEIAHQVLHQLDPDLWNELEIEWEKINQKYGLKYTGFSEAYTVPDKLTDQPGFASGYARTSLHEDIPETLKCLLTAEPSYGSLQTGDQALRAKKDLVFWMMKDDTGGVLNDDWREMIHQKSWCPTFHPMSLKPVKWHIKEDTYIYIPI